MKKFLLHLSLFFLIPVLGIVVLYLVCDPYKTLKPFSLEYFDTTNRDYLSSELFLMNYPEQHYNAFIFSSSQGGGLNTYHWKKYLSGDARPFLFQAWSETITGIEHKLTYLYDHSIPVDYALVMLDVPGMFTNKQNPTAAISIQDPRITGQPLWLHQLTLLYNFIQKPSQWKSAVMNRIHPKRPNVSFDPVTNDWEGSNKDIDLSIPPMKDSLKNVSSISRAVFLKEIENKTDEDLKTLAPLMDASSIQQMKHIRSMFDSMGTDYRVVISPAYCYTNPAFSPDDRKILEDIFGAGNVFDFSGKNYLSDDFNNFSDPSHFGLYVGWHMIEDIYNPERGSY